MKKALLLVLLVPFFALSQSTLATWSVTSWPYSLTPATASGITASALTGTGINFPSTGDSNGVATSGWPSNGNYDDAKYVQFTLTSASGFAVNSVTFDYRGDAKKHKIQYSVDNFATTLGNAYDNSVTNNDAGEWAIFSNNQTFSTPLTVAAGKTLKVRIYAAQGSARYIKNITVTGGAVTTPLNGTYVIGASAQSTYPQFTTITAAVAYLNNYGVSGPVTFLLKDATYTSSTETFPLTITEFTGTSATNRVTFKPYPGVDAKIEATNLNNYTGIPAIFYINGADNIYFDGSNTTGGYTRNLTLYNKDYIDYVERSVLWVASNGNNPATNISIKYCNIHQAVKNQGGKFCVGVYSGNNGIGSNNTMTVGVATANNANLTVANNDFMNVKQGVYVNGGTGNNTATNISVTANDLGASTNAETIICPATFSNVDTFTFSLNYINNLYRNTDDGNLVSAGIYVTGASSNGTITRNNIKDVTRTVTNNQIFGGIVLASSKSNTNILVANNFVVNVAAAGNGGGYLNGYGIVVDQGGQYKIYNNTVSLNTNQPQGGFSAAFYVGANAGNGLDVRNNIFVNNQTNTATRRTAVTIVKAANQMTSTFANLDYNNYFSSDRIAYVANVNGTGNVDWAGNGIQGSSNDNADYFYTLQSWKTTTAKDAHTVNINPIFASTKDLHIVENNTANDAINNTGTPLADVTKDIDNQIRSTTTPDMGADEFGTVSFPAPGGTTGVYCSGSTTWNGTSWNNGSPSADKDAIFNGNYSQTGGTFYACSMYVLNGASVNFLGNAEITVTHSVNIQTTGNLTIESGSNLVQIEDDINTGTATIKRDSGRLKRLDYTLWCAPVLDSRTTGYQTLRNFSPMTSNGRFYDYHTSDNNYWPLPETTAKFELLKGVLIRMPNSDATTGYNTGAARMIYHGSFTGTPNTGTIRKTLEYYSNTQGYNVVGNPYPSPLSATDFINANANSITGTIWLWRKTNDQTQASYSTVNLGGYVANVAPGGTTVDGNDLIVDPYTINTKGSLNTAQGFFVKATGENKELVYRNSMRLQSHSTAFFKSAAAAQTQEEEAPQFDRVWLNVTNDNALFAQALIGYKDGSSTGFDHGYDGESLTSSSLNLYTVMHTETDTLNLAIQTRGNFVVTDQVALGFSAAAAGTYTISIDHSEGAFANGQKVYIKDNAEGITRELTANNFTFTTEAGQFDDRFTVLYTTATDTELGTEPIAAINKNVMVYNAEGQVKVVAPSNIKSVVVYDMTGKVLYQNAAVNNVEFSSSALNATHQVVLVTVTLDNQKVVTKKLMMM
jgi:trimeric autotransporter adhesin